MTPAERLRKHQNSITKAVRELERERGKLEGQEKKTMMDIKKNAKSGNMVGGQHLQHLLSCAERLQDPRQGSRPDTALHPEVYADESAAASCIVTDADAEE